MLTVISGGADSGKSSFAEDIVCKSSCSKRYYIATMKAVDEAAGARIKKHRRMRDGKGFVTLEIPIDINEAVSMMDDPADSVALLECVSNLVANMMYDDSAAASLCRSDKAGEVEFAKLAVSKVTDLAASVKDLVVVISIYPPKPEDDDDTRLYKRLLNLVNIKLSDLADNTYIMNSISGSDSGSYRE